MNILFVCNQNRLRKPTAAYIYPDRTDITVSSAGINDDVDNPVDAERIGWADLIVVGERPDLDKLRQRIRAAIGDKRIVLLHIPDVYEFNDPHLVRTLQARTARFLP